MTAQAVEALERAVTAGLSDPRETRYRDAAADFSLLYQVSSLICEAGHFQAALELLQPFTTEFSNLDHRLLNIRGWIHQNCLGDAHAEEGIRCYQAALEQLDSNRSREVDKSDQDQQASKEELRWWYRKGLANAKHRRPETRKEAELLFRGLADELNGPGPLKQRIRGWCLYKLGEFQAALESYKAALDADLPRLSAQFDQGLILFSTQRELAADQQYRAAVLDLREANPVRRCGILRVSLFELCNAVMERPQLRSDLAERLVDLLFAELEGGIDSLPAELKAFGNEVLQAAREIRSALPDNPLFTSKTSPDAPKVLRWDSTDIVGFLASPFVPCGAFLPIVKEQGSDKLEVLEQSGSARGLASVKFRPPEDNESIYFLPFKQPANPTAAVLYVANEYFSLTGASGTSALHASTLEWMRVAEPLAGSAACTSIGQAKRILQGIARELCVGVVRAIAASKDREFLLDRTRMAIFAAADENTLYQASLCYILAGGNIEDIELLAKNAPASTSPSDLKHAAGRLGKIILQLGPDPLSVADSSEEESPKEQILKRAKEITNSRDESLRITEAIRAAGEMQLCLPDSPDLNAVQERVAQRLSRCDVLYLEAGDEILALSREPAFFCSLNPKLSKAALDAFAFFGASAKYARIQDGPIAIKAKAAVARTTEIGPSDLVEACGGIGKAVHTIVSITRALWRIVMREEAGEAGGEKQRSTTLEQLAEECRKLDMDSLPKAFDAVFNRMLQKAVCWLKGDKITYRTSVVNALDLCRILLKGARPDHDIRYFVWREVRRYYGFAQSPEVAHHIYALSAALNDLVANRRKAGLTQGHTKGVTWGLAKDILPLIHKRISRNFSIPVKMSEFFLECCRYIDYMQLSTHIGRVEIRATEIDAEYLLSQLFGLPTGIKGLDDLFGGGGIMLAEGDPSSGTARLGGRTVLVVGPFGTGKSLLTLQMAVEVARKGGVAWVMALEQSAEECLYTLESMGRLPDDIPVRIANSVPKAIEVLENPEEDKGALILVRTVKETFKDFIAAFEHNAKLMSGYALRLIVVDPVSAISQGELRGTRLRSEILRLFESVKRQGTNVWLVSEESTGDEPVVEQNIADTVIHLKYESSLGYSQRYFEITKSRLQREHRGAHAFAIGPGRGITIYPSSSAVRSWIQKRTSRSPDTPISFGLPSIDELLGKKSLYAGDVIVLEGTSGSGMTRLNLAFLLSLDDLASSEEKKKQATTMLLTTAEGELSLRNKLQHVYDTLGGEAGFACPPHRVRIVGLPGGYVKPGYILQQIADEFERARIMREPIGRVSVDSIAAWELGCPFVSADHTFGDTLVELFRKHRVTSLFLCDNFSGHRGSVLQKSILNTCDCLIHFQTLPVKGTPEPHVSINKTRTMGHRRGTFRLQLESLDASPTTTLVREIRPGEVEPIKIRLFLHSESDMQTDYNQAILMAVRGVLSRDAELAEESPIHFSRALGLGAASALDELQVIQLDEYQVPLAGRGNSALYRFDAKQWDKAEWDDVLPSLRDRIQSDGSFTAAPFYENLSLLAWRTNVEERSTQSWRALAAACEAWERENPPTELFFDFPGVTGENYNCLFLEILQSLAPIPEPRGPQCRLFEWLSENAAVEASFLFRKLCYRAYAHRSETLQPRLVKAAPFTASSKAQVWRHWYTTLNQMLSGMSRKDRSNIRVGSLPGSVSTAGEWYLGVPAHSAAPDVGLKLMKLLTTHEAESDRLRLGVGLPTRDSFYTGTPGRSSISPLFAMDAALLRGLLTNAFKRSSFGCYPKFTNLLTVYLQDLMENEIDDDDELHDRIRSRLDDLQRRLSAVREEDCTLCTLKKSRR